MKPKSIEVRENEIVIRLDENEIKFINSILNNPLGVYVNSLDNYLSEKKELQEKQSTPPILGDENSTIVPLHQFESFYKEYQTFSNEKQTILLKMKELHKLIQHSEMKNFNEYCGNLFNVKKVSHLCEYCKINSYPTIKSLSAHQRKCKLIKASSDKDDEEEDEIELEE
jgi:hypothetical protein